MRFTPQLRWLAFPNGWKNNFILVPSLILTGAPSACGMFWNVYRFERHRLNIPARSQPFPQIPAHSQA
jgi:hypothetical protein